jgi:co-chaperonin GroES (HSP10)
MREFMTVESRLLEQEIDELALELFTTHETQFIPTHPWVFVRILPREQLYKGLIVLPDNKSQNKPVHEGIVLSTWLPFTHRWREQHNGEWIDCEKEIHTDFEIGDHVAYPHWTGMPAPGWDERYYRLVPEHTRTHRGIDMNAVIYGKIEYAKESVRDKLMELTQDNSETSFYAIADIIMKEFDVVPKQQYSRTVSGK